MKVVVNIPAFNEAEKIGETIKNIPRTFEGVSEVLVQVVDDGSTDGTADVARAAGADFVISHTTNRKLGYAFCTAVENVLDSNADIMVNIDADGQFNAQEIQKLITPILSNKADMVVGSRFGNHKAHNMPWIKLFLNRMAAAIVGGFLHVKIDDLTCGFRAHSRETLLRLNPPTGFTYTQETIIDAIGKGLKLVWVPVTVTYFANRKSRIVSNISGFVNNSARIIIKAVRDVRPMKFFGIPGLILLTSGAVILFYFFILYLQDFKITPFRNVLILAITLLLIGLQFFVFALIADMIKSSRKLTEELLYQLRKERYSSKKKDA